MHEAQMHKDNCFVTLTYDQEHLPENNNLQKIDAQKFLRRLRKSLGKNTLSGKVRFYMAGEYGEQYGRPHFHICLFGIDFHDKQYLRKTPAGSKLYTSEKLQQLWTKGFSSVGAMTFESAAYTARYIMKKMNGKNKEKHYTKINIETGEIYKQEPEYNNMSRKPGIGSTWIEKYKDDVYPEGKVIVRGKKSNSPRYYNDKYKTMAPLDHEAMQYGRHIEAIAHAHDNTPERLKAREIVADAKAALLKRNL